LTRLGILGGTFNPPHLGHLALARHARDELGLELVALVPAHTSPHKAGAGGARRWPGGRDPGPEHRLRMCRLAVDGEPGLSVCAIEIERGGLSYTVDTLQAIRADHPSVELTLIVGADVAATLGSWREPARLLELAQLAVAGRPGAELRLALDGSEERVRFVDMPAVAVSSSLVRERSAAGEPIEELVGPAVAAYIAEHDLYRAPTAGAQAGIEVAG
jgi:nicotinate-nucleotide adenylyltransferase